MSRVDNLRSYSFVHLLWVMIQFWSIGSLHRDLTKFTSVIRRALAFISRTALASIHAWKVANNYSEVSGCQSVSSMAILTDEGGGISLLTVVLTVALGASHFADAGCKDHLDATSVISQLER